MIQTKNNRFDLESIDEAIHPLTKQYKLFPYTMHYLYFNLASVKKNKLYTFILAHSKVKAHANAYLLDSRPSYYFTFFTDFIEQKILTKTVKLLITENELSAENFNLKYDKGEIYLRFYDDEYTFDKLLIDSYVDKLFGGLYDWTSINFGNEDFYFNAQNVIKRGPLPPWNWLHFYFEDGTYIKTFNTTFSKLTPFRINDKEYDIDKIEEDDSTIKYYASKGDKYFNISFKKAFRAIFDYKPFLSPTWHYNQVRIELINYDTNIDSIKLNQSGIGIIELARGWSL